MGVFSEPGAFCWVSRKSTIQLPKRDPYCNMAKSNQEAAAAAFIEHRLQCLLKFFTGKSEEAGIKLPEPGLDTERAQRRQQRKDTSAGVGWGGEVKGNLVPAQLFLCHCKTRQGTEACFPFLERRNRVVGAPAVAGYT